MKTWFKWALSVAMTLLSFSIISGLTYLIATVTTGCEIPETLRLIVVCIGFFGWLCLIFITGISMFKEMIDNIERKKRVK